MPTSIQTATVLTNPPSSKARLRTGRTLSGLVVLFLAFDSVLKFLKPAPVIQAFAQTGWPDRLAVPLGIILLTCTALYVIPRTSILGAILLTGYLGGAVLARRPPARAGAAAKLTRANRSRSR